MPLTRDVYGDGTVKQFDMGPLDRYVPGTYTLDMTTMISQSQVWDEIEAIEALPSEQRNDELLSALVELAKSIETYHKARLRTERARAVAQ